MSKYNADAYLNPKSRNVTIMLKGKKYLTPCRFTIGSERIYRNCLKETSDPKRAIALLILKNLEECKPPIPTLEDIVSEDEAAFAPFVFSILGAREGLESQFDQTEKTLPLSQRFATAYASYYESYVDALAQTMTGLTQSLQEAYNPIQQIQRTVGQIVLSAISPIQDAMKEFAEKFSNLFVNLQIPDIPDERVQELLAHHKRWGELGWSAIPNAPVTIFARDPGNVQDADKMAMAYCKDKDMRLLFSTLKEKNIRKSDLNEAIFCYDHRQYKACALLLFGLIESKIIRKQSKHSNKRRKVGLRATQNLKEKFDTQFDTQQMLFSMLSCANLFSCLETFFADGEDFRREPQAINRNFVAHGMNTREVRKRDCIQLFLVLDNLMDFLDFM